MYPRAEPGGKVTVGIRLLPTLFTSSGEECVGSIALIKPFLAVLCHGVVELGRKASIPAKLDNCRLPVWWHELLTSVWWAGQWGEKTSPSSVASCSSAVWFPQTYKRQPSVYLVYIRTYIVTIE